MMVTSLTLTDEFIAERGKYFCINSIPDASYARINFVHDTELGNKNTYLNKMTAGTLRTRPSVSATKSSQLLQKLWNVKRQMLQNRFKFYRVAKYLETTRECRQKAAANVETVASRSENSF